MRQVAAACVVLFAALANVAQAADDPSGTWKWDVEFKGKTTTSTLKLKLDGNKLTGVYIGGASGNERQIQDGTYADGKLTFSVKSDTGTIKTTLEYNGVLKGDTIAGKIDSTFDRNGDISTTTRDWEAKRQR